MDNGSLRFTIIITKFAICEFVISGVDCTYYPCLGIPSYNWLNDDEHGVHEAHATSFPNGCALGAMWDKQTMLKVGAAVGLEARVGHNGYVHTGEDENPRQSADG